MEYPEEPREDEDLVEPDVDELKKKAAGLDPLEDDLADEDTVPLSELEDEELDEDEEDSYEDTDDN